MPLEQFDAGTELIKELMDRCNIPLINVLRHKDIVSDITHKANSTLCPPGKNFPFIQMLDSLRDGEPFFDIGEDYPYIKEIKYLKEKGVIKGDRRDYPPSRRLHHKGGGNAHYISDNEGKEVKINILRCSGYQCLTMITDTFCPSSIPFLNSNSSLISFPK